MKTRSLPSYLSALKKATPGACLSVLLLCFAFIPSAEAGAVTASVAVRAVVLPRASIKIIREPATITVTHEDIVKGYVDGGQPSLIEVRSNSRSGCVLTVDGGGPFKETEMTLEGRTVTVGPQGGMIIVRVLGRQIVPLKYRFILGQDSRPGTYPWPFTLSVSPLE